MRRRLVLGWLLLPTMILAGCNGDGGEKATTTSSPSTTPVTSSTTSTAVQDPAKVAMAKAAVLQPGDFPAGWQAKPDDERLDHETTWQDLTRCLGSPDSARGLGSAVSPTFNHGVATQVTSAVEYLAAGRAQAIAAAFAGPTFSSCAKDAFGADVKRNAPPGASTGSVEIAPLDLPKLGEATFAYRVKAGVDMGVKITIFQDLTYVFKGDAVARVPYLNPGAPFDPALQPTLVQKVVGRA